MNTFLTFLKDNQSILVLIISLITLCINIYVTSTSNYQKKKEISIKNLDSIMENFLNNLYLNKNTYLRKNKKIFDKHNISFFINKSHLLEYHLRILLTDIYKIETSNLNLDENKIIKEKYIASKKAFFEVLDKIYSNNILILENEISFKNMFWQFPICIKVIFFISILFLGIGIIFNFIKNKVFIQNSTNFLYFISFIIVLGIVINYWKYSKKTPYDYSAIYFFKRYVLKDKKLYCFRCQENFNIYNGTKIQCPKKHKFTFFIVKNKNLNLLKKL